MFALALALFAVGPTPQNLAKPQAPPQVDADRPKTVSPVTVTAKTDKGAPIAVTIDMPSDDTAFGEFVSIWPVAAYYKGTEGRATLRCRISIHGIAEVCGVLSESPDGQGFGAAAMQLRPTFKLKPIKGPDGGAIEAQVDIAVKFHPPRRDLDVQGFKTGTGLATSASNPGTSSDPHPQGGAQNPWSRGDAHNNVVINDRIFIGNPTQPHPVTMLSRPVWAQAPGFDDVAAAYPAKAAGAEGYVVAHCQVTPSGDLKNCASVKETPDGVGFAKAALPLAYKFKVDPALAHSPDNKPLWVDIPIRLPPPDPDGDRTVSSPHWLTEPSSLRTAYPAQASARGVASGVGVADCMVGEGGVITNCSPGPDTPAGLGFSQAVADLASNLKVALWSDDAGPVQGGQIRVEVRLQKDGAK